jgi:hypothetical protein
MHMVILECINIFFSGILAGLEIAAHYGFHEPALALDKKSQIILRQGIIRKLRWLVPAFFVPTALTGIVLLFIKGMTAGFLFRLIAVAAIIVWIFVRIIATVSTNSATLEWNPNEPPQNWKEQVDHAERFHSIGTGASIVIFICFLIALILQVHALV